MGMTPTRPRLALLALAAALTLLSPACKKPANRPPDIPSTPAGPTTGGIGTVYEFSSTATDPDDDPVALRFAWGDGDTTDWSYWITSGETLAMVHAWHDTATFQVTVQARDDSGARFEWSPPAEVTIVPAPGMPER